MNNRQAGAFRELIWKEERTREKWLETWRNLHAQQAQQQQQQQQQQPSFNTQPLPAQSQPVQQSVTQALQPQQPQQRLERTMPATSHPIYQQAARISSPRVLEESKSDESGGVVTRRVVRQVEVPVVKDVKVTVKTSQIMPIVVQKKVKTKKLVEVPSWQEVDEEYTEVLSVPSIRQKEIWVKKIVPEKFVKSIPIKKTRKVKVPTSVLKAVDDYEVVNVTESKAVEVDGYRVDQIHNNKLMEVEEVQSFEPRQNGASRAEVVGTRDLGQLSVQPIARRVGTEVYHPMDERIRNLEEDRFAFGPNTTIAVPPPAAVAPTIRSASASTLRKSYPNAPAAINGFTDTNGSAALTATSNDLASITSRLGIKVRNSSANGILVARVQQDTPAQRAGLQSGDVVMYVNNRPSRNLGEFHSVIGSISGPVQLQVRRRGNVKLLVTLTR